MKTRKKHTSEFKTKVFLEALSECYTIQELGLKYDLHPNQITSWKNQFLENSSSIFSNGADQPKKQEGKQDHLYKIIGQQRVRINILKKAFS